MPEAVFASLLLHSVFLLLYVPNAHLFRVGKIVHAPLIITLAPKITPTPKPKPSEKSDQKGQDAFDEQAQLNKIKPAQKPNVIAKAKKVEKPNVKAAIKPSAVEAASTTPELTPTLKPIIKPAPPTEVQAIAKPKPIEAEKPVIKKKAVVIEHPPIMLTPEKKPIPLVETKPIVKPTPVVETPPTVESTPEVETETKTKVLQEAAPKPIDAPTPTLKPDVTPKPVIEPAPTLAITPLPEIAPSPEPIYEPLPEPKPLPIVPSIEPPTPVNKPKAIIAPQIQESPKQVVMTPKPDPEPKQGIKVMAKAKTIEEPPTFTVPEEMANVPRLKHTAPTQTENRTQDTIRDTSDQRLPNLSIPRDIYAMNGGVTAPNSQASPSGGATDMMSHIKQQREARAMQGDPSAINALQNTQRNHQQSATASGQTVTENLNTTIIHHRGMFKITTLRQYEGTFSFKGWRGKYSNTTPRFYRVETFDAREDIRLLMVNKMIEVIQHDYKGEFQWQSNRFSHVVTLSADPKYHGELQQFLLDEFKPEFDALSRP